MTTMTTTMMNPITDNNASPQAPASTSTERFPETEVSVDLQY